MGVGGRPVVDMVSSCLKVEWLDLVVTLRGWRGTYQVTKERKEHTTKGAVIPPFDDDLLASIHYGPQHSVPTDHYCACKLLHPPRCLSCAIAAALERSRSNTYPMSATHSTKHVLVDGSLEDRTLREVMGFELWTGQGTDATRVEGIRLGQAGRKMCVLKNFEGEFITHRNWLGGRSTSLVRREPRLCSGSLNEYKGKSPN